MQRNSTSPRGAHDDEEGSPQPDVVPSFLTARELQVPHPTKGTARNEDASVKRKPGDSSEEDED